MSELIEFESDKDYIKAQRAVTLRKIERARVLVSVKTVNAIWHHFYMPTVFKGLCHGVRQGGELALFESKFGGGDWIGTEIVEELCDGERIIHANFSDPPRPEWLGHFDIIYSNSLDHARDPLETVKTWLTCLVPNGFLYIEWTRWHSKIGNRGNRADCFAATEEEYLSLLEKAGSVDVDNVIEFQDQGSRGGSFKRVIFPVQ